MLFRAEIAFNDFSRFLSIDSSNNRLLQKIARIGRGSTPARPYGTNLIFTKISVTLSRNTPAG